jgi:hypothetical protein
VAEPFRIDPGGTPADFQTFGVRQFVRPSPCAEARCTAHAKGWRTTVAAGSDAEAFLLRVCRGEEDGHRRGFVTIPQENGLTQYVFEAGQTCFAVSTHQVALQRPPLYLRRNGDWRANLGGTHVYDRGDQLQDDLHTRTETIRHIKETRS